MAVALVRGGFPPALEALLRARGPGVVCHFRTRFGYEVDAALLRLETRGEGQGPGRGLCAILRREAGPHNVTEVLEVATLAEVSCDGPPGWAEALP